MKVSNSVLKKVSASVLRHAIAHFQNEFDLEIEVQPTATDERELDTRETTAIVAFGGKINLIVAFSFEASLVEYLTQKATIGIRVDPGEHDIMMRETVAEVVNDVVGHSTGDLAVDDEIVTITPPVVLTTSRHVFKPKDAVFVNVALTTNRGEIDIWFIGPRELFSDSLELC